MKIATVGDLSLQDPSRLAFALDSALEAADFVVQVGNIHPAYDEVKTRLATNRLLVIPGNYDADFDQLGTPRNWIKTFPDVNLIGIDNSQDKIADTAWNILRSCHTNKPTLVFIHKPLSQYLEEDGKLSSHIMGEPDTFTSQGDRLKQWLFFRKENTMLITGHYHGWAYLKNPYADVLIDGRGGATPQIGFTTISLSPEGWSIHRSDISSDLVAAYDATLGDLSQVTTLPESKEPDVELMEFEQFLSENRKSGCEEPN